MFAIVLVFTTGSMSFASIEGSSIEDSQTTKVTHALAKIEDSEKKELIEDAVLTPIYTVTETDVVASKETMIDETYTVNLIEQYAKLSTEELNKLLQEKLMDAVAFVQSNPNATFLDEGYIVAQKYLPKNELNNLNNLKTKQPQNIKNEDITLVNKSTTVYRRSGSKKAYNGFGIQIGTVTLNVAWTVSSRKIISYSKSIKGSVYSTASITGSGIPAFYKGQRAYVKGMCVWIPGVTAHITAWFYNDGGFDIT